MLLKGVFLMFIGMGIVFIFLWIMVVTVNLQARIIKRFFPEQEEEEAGPQKAAAPASPAAELAAAVGTALRQAGRQPDGPATLYVDGRPFSIEVNEGRATVDGVSYTSVAAPAAEGVAAPIAALPASHRKGGLIEITAPLPGLVLRLPVKPGDTVNAGDVLVVLESMKMETPIKAPTNGLLAELRVSQGQQVKSGQVLAFIGD